ncbi:hypothetical protein DL766_009618 [Monosporascus sp. MC13-8B]|uniref:Uncharacterized protein n=1 Tax=Monosporascus cannonballus TaxID=155416 RepID=A0ABY0GUR7_9PEZI|nr:hypothetical protein DL762_009214 [Monosporascus cannonballus]RYO79446.1 hypothetical protein DL763_009256 [Monosporascus cannonballus]RYP14651.1 hypothetical protein DL766_009618 [Monosporascus sp. MC13-8B]
MVHSDYDEELQGLGPARRFFPKRADEGREDRMEQSIPISTRWGEDTSCCYLGTSGFLLAAPGGLMPCRYGKSEQAVSTLARTRPYNVIPLLLHVALVPLLVARTCSRPSLGSYRDHIVETLQAADQSTHEAHVQNSRFDCLSDGDISYRKFCSKGCGGTDSEDPD